jgi:hypothetical protein
MRTLLFWIIAGSLFLTACQGEEKTNLKPLDLLKYGVPITIMAPDSANVKTMDMVVQKDITVKGEEGDGYFVQIYAADASTNDINKLKAEQLAAVKANPYFSKIVKEDAAGFLYETKIDSSTIIHGFRYVKIQGNKEYIFQTGSIGMFTLEDAEMMYQAVQQEK